MANMSGAALSSASAHQPPPPPRLRDDELFTGLVVSNPAKVRKSRLWMPASLAGHALAAALLVLVPILWPDEPPELSDPIRALIYNPPPPPPPPLPKGRALVETKVQPSKPVTPETKPEKPVLTAEIEVPKEEPLKPEARDSADEQFGSEDGSDFGDAAGMEGGVEGGVVGGVLGGVLGGVIGGTGDGPVMDYDSPPRLIKNVRPQYPQEAFVKKIEGTVLLEILIDRNGRVVQARVIQSIPALDTAARQTVLQWIFQPAMKHGRPVTTVAHAPVNFRIF
jgi:protein TonB